MVLTSKRNAIASGHDNIEGLVNIETIKVENIFFNIVDDLNRWSDGVGGRRGDGIIFSRGRPRTTWEAGFITEAQWEFLYTSILRGNRSGKVTIVTQRYREDFYVICNAVLDIGDPSALNRAGGRPSPFVYRFVINKVLEEELVHGDIYTQNGSTAQTGITTTPTKLTGFAANGLSSGTTPAHTTDDITIAFGGDYTAQFHIDAIADASTQFVFTFYINGVTDNYSCELTTNATPDPATTGMIGRLSLSANDVITVYVKSDNGSGASLTPRQLQLTLQSLSLLT